MNHYMENATTFGVMDIIIPVICTQTRYNVKNLFLTSILRRVSFSNVFFVRKNSKSIQSV